MAHSEVLQSLNSTYLLPHTTSLNIQTQPKSMEIPGALATRGRRQLLTSYPLSQCCFPCMCNCKQGDRRAQVSHSPAITVCGLPSAQLPLSHSHWGPCVSSSDTTDWQCLLAVLTFSQTSVARHSHHTSLWTSCPKCLQTCYSGPAESFPSLPHNPVTEE